ncbi:hypothetical protein ACE1AT_12640 [Pelatocladus sp. BLCC-F211]|uniref:hypothetical protein n=1 Tax=Pelatocladus sp. BLCC-F211 TaxID=3342752 RepID=UPI0035BB9A77
MKKNGPETTRVFRTQGRNPRTQVILRNEKESGEHDFDGDCHELAGCKGCGDESDSQRACGKDGTRRRSQYHGSSDNGGAINQLVADYKEQLADNEIEIEAHEAEIEAREKAIARLKSRNQKLKEQLSRLQELRSDLSK